ncbi:SbtR family transcriptional regulator [Actinoallomurus soli]|uniref:SbtR family transcriptional regulator n=1 Tax=Actinoallomurus soli TaxID=2952535 RepID=UPI003872CB00
MINFRRPVRRQRSAPGLPRPSIGDAMTALLDAGKAAGAIRPDVDARDVILLIGHLTRLDEEWETRARHLLHVVLDGLRSRE